MRTALPFLVLFLLTPPGLAQDTFFEEIAVEIVNLDVTVTTRAGEPVRNLTREDFILEIDGRKVEIASFTASTSASATPAISAEELEVPESAPIEPVAVEPTYMVVYVDNFYLQPAGRKRFLRDIPAFLDQQIDSGAQVMVVAHGQRIEALTPFTNDRGLLHAAVARIGEMPAGGIDQSLARSTAMRNIQDLDQTCPEGHCGCTHLMLNNARMYKQIVENQARGSISALQSLIQALSVLEGRKILVHASDGIQLQGGAEIFSYVEDICPGAARGQEMVYDNIKIFNSLVAEANAARVTFYNFEITSSQMSSAASVEFGSREYSPSGATDRLRVSNLQNTLFMMADETGGKAILNNNKFGHELAKAAADFRTFYSLAYQPDHDAEGEAHRVDIRLRRGIPGQVRHRKSFLHKSAEHQLADKTFGALVFGVTTNPLGVEVAPGPPRAKDGAPSGTPMAVPLVVRLPLDNVTLFEDRGARRGQLILTVAMPEPGREAPALRRMRIPLELPIGEGPDEHTFGVGLELPPGSHELGVGVWDALAARGSFLNVAVEVPSG